MLEGKYVIVRDNMAGVYAGVVEAEEPGQVVWLRAARQLWSWAGAQTCLCLAARGTIRPEGCKFTAPHPGLVKLTADSGVYLCSPEAQKSITEVPIWSA